MIVILTMQLQWQDGIIDDILANVTVDAAADGPAQAIVQPSVNAVADPIQDVALAANVIVAPVPSIGVDPVRVRKSGPSK